MNQYESIISCMSEWWVDIDKLYQQQMSAGHFKQMMLSMRVCDYELGVLSSRSTHEHA